MASTTVNLSTQQCVELAIADSTGLSAAGFFYRNDSPGGFGAIFTRLEAQRLIQHCEHFYQSGFLRMSPQSQKEFLDSVAWEQLKLAGTFKGSPAGSDESVLFLVLGCVNVWILSREDRMPQDEFNGLCFSFDYEALNRT